MGLQTNPRPVEHIMAIYSLNHKAIGKTTQDKPFTAAAHIRYITRSSACREVLGENMPIDPHKAQRWYRDEEKSDRKNARMCDKVMIALPKELNGVQRHDLVKEFAEIVTGGKTPWLAAIHDKGKDRENPHCHLVIRDRDPETGKRVLHMSAGKKERSEFAKRGIYTMHTDRIRIIWEKTANRHLEQAGYSERIDRRTLQEQGIQQEPTVHEGAQAHKLAREGKRPESKIVEYNNASTARRKQRQVDYRVIDGGLTRQEYNAKIRAEKSEKEFARQMELADDSGDGHRKPPETTRKSRRRNCKGRSRKDNLGRAVTSFHRRERTQYPKQSGEKSNNLGESHGHRQYDHRLPQTDGHRNSSHRASIENPGDDSRRIIFRRNRNEIITGTNMSDKERLEALLAQYEDERDKFELIKQYNNQSEQNILKNIREHAEGLKSDKDAKASYETNANMKRLTEEKLKQTEAGKNYLYGRGKRDAMEQLHEEDAEERKKAADAKRLEKIEANLKKGPPMQAAVVSEQEMPKEDKGKAAEIMAFLATEEAKLKQSRPSDGPNSPAAVLEEEGKKKKKDWGMGDD